MITWQYYALGSATFAALTVIFGKIGVSELNSNLATFLRTIVILFFSALIITYRKEWGAPEVVSSKSIIFLFLSGLATGCSWLCYYRALQIGPASKVATVDKLSVLLVVVFSIIFLGEQLTWKVAIGVILVGAGAILMAF